MTGGHAQQAGGSSGTDDIELQQTPSVKSAAYEDPFVFYSGIKSEQELAALRKRKQGKRLENYHTRQNAVRSALSLSQKLSRYLHGPLE